MRDTETQAEGKTGSTWVARCGTRSRVSRTMPRAEGSAKPLSLPGRPEGGCYKLIVLVILQVNMYNSAKNKGKTF